MSNLWCCKCGHMFWKNGSLYLRYSSRNLSGDTMCCFGGFLGQNTLLTLFKLLSASICSTTKKTGKKVSSVWKTLSGGYYAQRCRLVAVWAVAAADWLVGRRLRPRARSDWSARFSARRRNGARAAIDQRGSRSDSSEILLTWAQLYR